MIDAHRSLRLSLLLAVVFCLALVLFEYQMMTPGNTRLIFIRHWTDGNVLRLIVFCLLSLAGILLTLGFIIAAITSRAVYRPLYFIIFAVLISAEYLVYRAYRRFSELREVSTAITGIDVGMGLDAVAAYFNWLALIPLAVFAVFLVATRRTNRNGATVFLGLAAAFVVFFGATTYFTKNTFYAPAFANAVRSLVSYPAGWYIGHIDGAAEGLAYGKPRAALTFKAEMPPANNVVFIVDESIRGDRLSVNGYPKPTTVVFDRLKSEESLATWGIASSWTTCSHTTNPLLLTGLNKLPDKEFNVHQWPTIFQYAKAMGYKNHYFDAYTDVAWMAKESDIPDFGNWVTESELSRGLSYSYEIDAHLGRRVADILTQSTGNFIWVHPYGVHTPYTTSFPNERYGEILGGHYDPYLQQEAIGEIYDRAISYSIDSFFSNLLASGIARNTTYVYTSDHGQTLRENGATVSHCAESRPEAIVPIVMIAEPSNLAGLDTSYKASHANLFATLLDLISYPEHERQFPYAISLQRARASDSAPRIYYSDQVRTAKPHPFDAPE